MADHEPQYGAASPLTWILQEEAERDRQLEHAVFLSFTLDLGFFEAIALGVIRSLGARVTVVGDARMSTPDPRAVRQAGRSYLPGLAIAPGAFHPKLVVLAGAQRCLLAVGSGNTTLAGWQNNAELWTVFRGTPDAAPGAVRKVGRWLRRLPDHVRFSRAVADSLSATAAHLELFPADGGPRVLSNLDRSLMEQLPSGPVDELRVFAPFHDPGAVALGALVEQLRPQRLSVAIQSGRTMTDGPALSRLLDRVGGGLIIDDDERYRHGKLIEWTSNGSMYALTGSPNLSTAALVRTPSTGGNCELAVLAETSMSLMPCGRTVTPAEATRERITVHGTPVTGPGLLGATLIDSFLHVDLTRPLISPGWIEVSPVHLPPTEWNRIADVDPEALEIQIPGEFSAGSRVRLGTTDGAGRAITSQPVYVTDPQRALQPVPMAAGRRRRTPADLVGDPALIAQLLTDLATLRTALSHPATAVSGSSRTGTADDWQSQIAHGTDVLGLPLVRFALGQPNDTEQVMPADPVWSEELDSDEAEPGLDDDTAEQTVEESTAAPDQPDEDGTARAKAEQDRRLRRWAPELAAAADGVCAIDQLLPARLLLTIIALEAWDHDDLTWFPLVADVLTALARNESPPPQAEAPIGSMAAVGLALLRMHTPRYEQGSERAIRYRHATTAVAHLLPAAEPDLVTEYTRPLTRHFGGMIDTESALALAAEIVQSDPIADAILALDEHGMQAHTDQPFVLHITGHRPNPAFAALDAIAAAQDLSLAAWASTATGRWALLVWRFPDLYRIEPDTTGAVLWRQYRCSRRITPRTLAGARDFDLAQRIPRPAMIVPIPEAVEIITSLGINPSNAPTCPLQNE